MKLVLFHIAVTCTANAACPIHARDPPFRGKERGHLVRVEQHRIGAALGSEFRRMAIGSCNRQKPARTKCRIHFEGEFSGGQSDSA